MAIPCDSQTSRQRRMCSMIGSGFVTSKECKCWSTISSVSTTPNRWPERKVGDRGETRLADISPCMFIGKKTRVGKILRTREELSGVSLIYILIYINLQIYHWILIRAYGIRHFQFPHRRRRSPVAVWAWAVGATCRRKIEG